MALSMCVTDLIVIFTKLILFLIEHWGWTLTFLLLGFFLRKFPFVLGGIATLLDLVADFLLGIGGATAVSGIGLLAALGALLFAPFIGMFWVIMIVTSKTNIIVRILAIPGAFVGGVIAGVLPFASAPSHLAIDFLTRNKTTALIACIIPTALLILFMILFGSWFCEILTTITTALLY